MREVTIQKVLDKKIIAIIRGLDKDSGIKLADALYAGGIELIEVTFDQTHRDTFGATAEAIRTINEKFSGKVLAGAGTVTSPELVDIAANAGAKYIISPDINLAVIKHTRELGLVSMPGAMSPTEIMTAHNSGADFVKLFPASELGCSYIKAIRAPISHVKLLAVGGINENNIREFLDAGVVGAGVGGNLVNKNYIAAGEFDKITALAKQFIANIK